MGATLAVGEASMSPGDLRVRGCKGGEGSAWGLGLVEARYSRVKVTETALEPETHSLRPRWVLP